MLRAYLAPRLGGCPPPAAATASAAAKMRSSCSFTVANRLFADWPMTASMCGEALPCKASMMSPHLHGHAVGKQRWWPAQRREVWEYE